MTSEPTISVGTLTLAKVPDVQDAIRSDAAEVAAIAVATRRPAIVNLAIAAPEGGFTVLLKTEQSKFALNAGLSVPGAHVGCPLAGVEADGRWCRPIETC